MLRAELYTELERYDLINIDCSKEELLDNLIIIRKTIDPEKRTLIVQVCDDRYKLYYSSDDTDADKTSIELDLAVRFRMEIDINEIEPAMDRVREAMQKYPFNILTDSYCLVRYLNLNDNFMIMDVFIGVEEKEKPFGYENMNKYRAQQ